MSRATWRKSSRSQGQGENCVEVAWIDPHVAVRDSKTVDSNILIVPQREWTVFIAEIKRG
ncbi:DUF397 domain-containing protein [Sphaerisporangium sp. NPDC051017]|uniref:DUF397 domain-containing protein n=1 Tax=Sphaerisporangium sp. NPDC051017 TaxID=3154636 RepID=UPI00342D675F